MPLIVPANEQGAGFMAAGYARASGRVGVALVTSGPGATNTVTPVRDCQADSVPIVVICGQVATTAIGTDAFQEAPVPSIMGAVAKHVFLVTDPTKLEATVRTAFEIARTGRPGPVVLDVPERRAELERRVSRLRPAADSRLPAAHESSAGEQVAGRRLRRFLCGAGRREAPADLCGRRRDQRRRLARPCASSPRTFQIPVVTTLMGIGAVDTTHPLSMRMLGMHGAAFANYAVEDCDFLLARRRAIRRSRGRQSAEIRRRRQVHRASGHRCLGDQQGQARRLEPRGPDVRMRC